VPAEERSEGTPPARDRDDPRRARWPGPAGEEDDRPSVQQHAAHQPARARGLLHGSEPRWSAVSARPRTRWRSPRCHSKAGEPDEGSVASPLRVHGTSPSPTGRGRAAPTSLPADAAVLGLEPTIHREARNMTTARMIRKTEGSTAVAAATRGSRRSGARGRVTAPPQQRVRSAPGRAPRSVRGGRSDPATSKARWIERAEVERCVSVPPLHRRSSASADAGRGGHARSASAATCCGRPAERVALGAADRGGTGR